MQNFNMDATIVRGDEEFYVLVEVEVQPGRSGFTSGRPEDCYPDDETEVEIVLCTTIGPNGKERNFDLTTKEEYALCQKAYEKWETILKYRY